ncbi:hypothetical protein DICPUDRAFT_31155 [Dictyostelium purpureum]|uniref:Ribosomal RNA-processing protein 43 n=1 Tax=Dictyostelium purpureum TaxID=5786 RepID=F0ZGR8_DICPU|nr:uncharacterized protein DICPUDRAFT_31155 [Dictyostelium purpureum]EGC36893.1 hypothetical protein DICPUDRAFT_31155 [Dictyostelium purpureum]|eukprot:XP_003286615.1 hypothetical protein DICPUDRAFT_31155 [Dictyostelium purpureum]
MEAFQKIHPLEFYRKFLIRSVRPDGRSLNDTRKTTISTGSVTTADGSSFVKIGNTSVVCGVRAEVGEKPSTDKSKLQSINNHENSNIFINIELGPICSNTFSSTKPSDMAMTLCSRLNSLINRLEIPDTDFYFDEEGKALWYLYVDIYCLDYDGNIYDAAVLSILSALKNVKLPKGIIENNDEYYKDLEQPLRELNIKHYLIPTSFSVIEDYILSDPSLEEEKLSTGTINITYNEHKEICLLLVTGINSISESNLKECMKKAKDRCQYIINLINTN